MNNHVTILEIDKNAILHNFQYFKKKLDRSTKVLAVVKSFGYGSDAVEIAKIVKEQVDYFAVAYTYEGVVLREAGIKTPILVLHPQLQNMEQIVLYHLEPGIYSFKTLNAFLKLADEKPLMNYPVHIKFNTGLNRLGFSYADVPSILTELKKSNNVVAKSIFTHLAASEDLQEYEFTIGQINNFAFIVKKIYDHLGYKPMIHALNTSGIINYTKAQFDMVRLGIGLYGFGNNPKETQNLKNTHNLKSIISQIQTIQPGETVGYNRAFVANKPTKTATIPIGHADGISRRLGNKNGFITINNDIAPIIGNVCMDMIIVDVTKIDCDEGDEVIIFNNQKHIEFMASKCETIPYEILTSISQRIKRLVKN